MNKLVIFLQFDSLRSSMKQASPSVLGRKKSFALSSLPNSTGNGVRQIQNFTSVLLNILFSFWITCTVIARTIGKPKCIFLWYHVLETCHFEFFYHSKQNYRVSHCCSLHNEPPYRLNLVPCHSNKYAKWWSMRQCSFFLFLQSNQLLSIIIILEDIVKKLLN